MRPLLWKEMRDLRGWLIGAAVLGLIELLLLARPDSSREFVSAWMVGFMSIAAAAVAIGLAAGQIAREHHAKTLDFLLVRPISPAVIVWSKFIVGTIALALLMAGIVALAYADPGPNPDLGIQAIREQVGLRQMLLILLPRYWFLYALTFLLSELADRTGRAATLAFLVAGGLVAVVGLFEELAPFSGFGYWLPFFDRTFGLLAVAKSPWLTATTGLVCSCGAILLAAASAALLKRSPERYLGDRGFVAVVVAVIGIGIATSYGHWSLFPVSAPAGSVELQTTGEAGTAGILASGKLVAVASDQSVRFLDFSQPSRPRQIAEVLIPLWNAWSQWNFNQAAMEGDTVFLVRNKKQVPVDDVEIAIVKPTGPVDAISLGPMRPGDNPSTPIPFGEFVYIGLVRDGLCSLLTFDRASKRQMSSLPIDEVRPHGRDKTERSTSMQVLRRGTYLYVTSPSYLTAIDIANPARPVATSRIPSRPDASVLYAFPRPLAWQDDRLFETRIPPERLVLYDLRDPAHPTAKAELASYGGFGIEGSGQRLYEAWRFGVLEFHSNGDELHALRYYRGDDKVSALAIAGDYIYALTTPDLHKRRAVQAFRIDRGRN